MRKKRALVLTGAGASIDFGAPSTADLTKSIEKKVLAGDSMRDCASSRAWLELKDALTRYYKEVSDEVDCEDLVNFEHIYHCAHELIFTFKPIPGAATEYRPVLVPFVERRTDVTQEAFRELLYRIAEFILAELSAVCAPPIKHLEPLSAFVAKLQEDHITRIYTTNYDDFILQADPDLYTGFNPARCSGQKNLDRQAFWAAFDRDCIFHLHGSVHLNFGRPPSFDADLGALYWYDDQAEALANSSQGVSDNPRMDGGGAVRTQIIIGLDKLSPLQRQPFSHYYASMARDAMAADVIYVIGFGLNDLHLNTWLGEARRRDPKPPLIFIDFWRNPFPHANTIYECQKKIAMIHTLRMPFSDHGLTRPGAGWSMDKNRTYAVWDKGFLEFLNAPDELDYMLEKLL